MNPTEKRSARPFLVLLALTVLVDALPGFAAEPTGEFSMPTFTAPPPTPLPQLADGGIPLSPPPLVNTGDVDGGAADAGKRLTDGGIVPAKPTGVPHWAPLVLSGAVALSFGRVIHTGGEGYLGFNFGAAPHALEKDTEHLGGALWQAGLIGFGGQSEQPECGTRTFCVRRFGGGGALRFGYAEGAPSAENVVRAESFYFGEFNVLGAYNGIPSAPLFVGRDWGELMLRARFGLNVSAAKNTILKLLTASVFFEAVPVSAVAPHVSGGFTVGLVL